MPAYVRSAGTWETTDVIYIRDNAGQARRVGAAFVWTTLNGVTKWWPVFNLTPPAPLNLRWVSATNSSASLEWDPVVDATGYVVTMKSGTTTRTAVPTPATATSYTWTGLAENTTYTFTVTAKNSVGIFSQSSNTRTLVTGQSEKRQQKSAFEWWMYATNTGSWDSEKKWARRPNKVAQGYFNKYPVRNSYGCVEYSTLWYRLRDDYGEDVASNVQITAASIRRIQRTNDSGASNARIEWYAGKADIGGSTARPSLTSEKRTFTAPAPDRGIENVWINPSWARQWADKDDPVNSLIIHRDDDSGNSTIGYSGYAVFESRGVENSNPFYWRLVLTISWNFVPASGVAKAPVTS
jgi:hypothetical protein